MTYRVRLLSRAIRDLDRLPAFLQLASPAAAARVRVALQDGLTSLSDFPERGRPAAHGLRELPIQSGRYGYIIRYRVTAGEVLVLRLRHARERARS